MLKLQPQDKALLIQLRAMGDTLMLTPLIRAFKQSNPDVRLDILVEDLPAQVLRNNPYLTNVHIASGRGSGPGEYIPLIRRLRCECYDLAVDFLSTPGSALLTRLTGARHRMGYRLRWRSWAYTHPVNRCEEPLYNPLTKFDLVRDLKLDPETLDLDLFIGDEKEKEADKAWKAFGFDDMTSVYGIAPWSKRPWRRWKNEAWLEVIQNISRSESAGWLLFAAEGERSGLAAIENHPGIDVRWAGMKDIRHAAALIKRCRATLCADNGLKHIAVAMKTPTLTIFTGSDPAVWNPPDDPRHQAFDLREGQYDRTTISRIAEAFERLQE